MIKLSSVVVVLSMSVGMVGLAAAGDPKTDPKAKAEPKAEPKMAEMKAPKELADMAKSMVGMWTCKGQGMGHDMKMTDMLGVMSAKLEMNGWWIHETFDSKMGKEPFHFEAYTTYDATAKKWHRVMAETGGGYAVGDSAGMTAGKIDWELSSHSMMGEAMFKDHADATDPKAVKAWGEVSMDKGKTWMKVYEMTCNKK